jgi:hypothetical protein
LEGARTASRVQDDEEEEGGECKWLEEDTKITGLDLEGLGEATPREGPAVKKGGATLGCLPRE